MVIDVTKKWAYLEDPHTEVEVVAPKTRRDFIEPLVSFDEKGYVLYHKANGACSHHSGKRLVPFEEPPREFYVILHEDRIPTLVKTKPKGYCLHEGESVIKVREVK